MKVIAAVLVAGALLLVAGPVKRAYDSAHIGAPALVYQCPAGTLIATGKLHSETPGHGRM